MRGPLLASPFPGLSRVGREARGDRGVTACQTFFPTTLDSRTVRPQCN